MYNFDGAAKHGIAAAAFGGVGIAAGLGARATYSAAGSTPAASSRSAPSYVSGNSGSKGNAGSGDTNITVVINGGFNTKDDMVRNLSAAINEVQRKTGRNPLAMA
jgi:hypothetical protein